MRWRVDINTLAQHDLKDISLADVCLASLDHRLERVLAHVWSAAILHRCRGDLTTHRIRRQRRIEAIDQLAYSTHGIAISRLQSGGIIQFHMAHHLQDALEVIKHHQRVGDVELRLRRSQAWPFVLGYTWLEATDRIVAEITYGAAGKTWQVLAGMRAERGDQLGNCIKG